MGKSSKSKSKKSAKQERAKHLNIVETHEKTMSTFENNYFSLGICRKRERIELLMRQIQLTLSAEESYAFINRYQSYKLNLSMVCSCQLFDMILSANYIQASNSLNDMMNYPLTNKFRRNAEPFSKVLLLWTGKEKGDRRDEIAKITEIAFDVIHRPEARHSVWTLFLEKTLILLIRQPIAEQYFEKVELLSLAMLKSEGIGELEKEWTYLARVFLVFSYIDKLRFYSQEGQEKGKIQAILELIPKMRPELSSSTIHLAYSLLNYYYLICKKEEHSLELRKKKANNCIESLEMHVAL